MRLFIAIEIPDEVKKEIQNSAYILEKYSAKGNFSRTENYHVTMAFLGEVNRDRITDIRQIIDSIDFPEMKVSIGQISYFRRDNGNIYFRELSYPKMLGKIYYNLADRLAEMRFDVRRQRFTAHITLSRETVLEKSADIKKINGNITDIQFTADALSLMSSERKNGKLIYTCLYKK